MSGTKHDLLTKEIFHEERPRYRILSMFPAACIPYVQLARLDRPIAISHIYAPYMFGCLYAASVSEDHISTPRLIWACISMFIASIILRSVGCAWNDIVDRDFDVLTRRCKDRPMAKGTISVTHAYIFCTALWLLWAQVLYQTATTSAILSAIPVPVLTTIYPYTKRFTHYPQLVLGVTLSIGCFVGSAQLDSPLHVLLTRTDPSSGYGLVALFVVYVIWTIIYDTVYAFQDLHDDTESGVLSTAVLFANRPALFLSASSTVQLICLVSVGYISHLGSYYYLTTCGGIAAMLLVMLLHLDVNNAQACLRWFKFGSLGFNAFVVAGLGLEYSSKV